VNAKDNDGKTPLDRASERNKQKNAEVLRAAGGKLGKDLP
jgi:ankyrin repeat protein